MKSKILGMFLAVLMLAAMAGPAAAVDPSVGVFAGTAVISQNGTCDTSTGEVTNASGKGLGLDTTGNYVWGLDLGLVADSARGAGTAALCGQLSAGLAGLGASCITTDGSNGGGTTSYGLSLSNMGWNDAVGGTFVLSGNIGDGTVTALVQAVPGDEDCVTNSAGGAAADQVLGVVAAYRIA